MTVKLFQARNVVGTLNEKDSEMISPIVENQCRKSQWQLRG